MQKKIIIDIGHPAQVHNFKYVYYELLSKGWGITVTLKNKEMASTLMDALDIPHKDLISNKRILFFNLLVQFFNIFYFTAICISKKPKIILSRGSIHSVISSRLLNIPHIYLSDTEHANDFSKYVDVVLTNSSFKKNLGLNHIRFEANIELFYLHPKYLNLNLNYKKFSDNNYILLRFVSWNAHHDINQKGLSLQQKIQLVDELSSYGNIYISSEKKLPPILEKFRLRINPIEIHQFIQNASLIYGESATIASEAAVLGIPAIYIDNVGRGYTIEEENYGLCYNFKNTREDHNKALEKAKELLTMDKSVFIKRHQKFLENKINPTSFLVWFIENYPQSAQIMRENPDYQLRFK